jgi:hypothetical protein
MEHPLRGAFLLVLGESKRDAHEKFQSAKPLAEMRDGIIRE